MTVKVWVEEEVATPGVCTVDPTMEEGVEVDTTSTRTRPTTGATTSEEDWVVAAEEDITITEVVDLAEGKLKNERLFVT